MPEKRIVTVDGIRRVIEKVMIVKYSKRKGSVCPAACLKIAEMIFKHALAAETSFSFFEPMTLAHMIFTYMRFSVKKTLMIPWK